MLVLVWLCLGLVLVQGEEDCKEVTRQFTQCTREAHGTYTAAIKKGDDGKPDFAARKSCNYLEDAVENCGNKLTGDCNSEEKVTKLKDDQIRQVLAKLQSSISSWDSDKCPPVRAHIERMKAVEGSSEAEPEGQQEPETVTEPENEVSDESSAPMLASMVVTSLLPLLLLL